MEFLVHGVDANPTPSKLHLAFRDACMALALVAAANASAEPVDAVMLPEVNVTAPGENAYGPAVGYKATRSATGTKTDTPLFETPASVQVITRELMEDQNTRSIKDAVNNVSGVYTTTGPDGSSMDSFIIRGFRADAYGSTYLDGVKDFSRAPKEMAGLERVEVLKGPAAIMYGRIEPGGMINRVSKRPQAEGFTDIEQTFGSYQYARTTLDSTGLVGENQNLLYRVVGAFEDADGFRDFTHNRRTYLAPQIEWRDPRTSIRIGLEYLKDDRSWALGYGTIGDANGPVDIPIERNLHDKDDHVKEDSLAYMLEWSHDLAPDLLLRQRLTWFDRDSVGKGSWISGANANGDYTREYWGWEDEKTRTLSTNLELLGKLRAGDLRHTVLLGVDYMDEDYDSGGWAFGGTPVTSNLHNPVYDAPYDLDYDVQEYWYKNRNMGAYLQDQIAMLEDRLHILIGTRYDSAKHSYNYAGNTFAPHDKALTWRGGLLYKLTPALAAYTRYVEGFGKSNYSWTTGEIFDPETSKQTEIGLKFEPSPRFGMTIAAFELVKDNLVMADPADPLNVTLAGEATSKGVELDVAGQITRDWDVVASYAYTDAKWTNSDNYQGERLVNVPRHGASLWTTYRFPGTGLKVGAGAIYRSSQLGVQRFDEPALYPYTLDAYTIFNLMARYEFKAGGHAMTAQLNINNVTDERYYPSSYWGSTDRITEGEPRMIFGSLKVSF